MAAPFTEIEIEDIKFIWGLEGPPGETLKGLYKRLAREFHPDKGGDTAIFQRINNAFSALLDKLPAYRSDFTETTIEDTPIKALFPTDASIDALIPLPEAAAAPLRPVPRYAAAPQPFFAAPGAPTPHSTPFPRDIRPQQPGESFMEYLGGYYGISKRKTFGAPAPAPAAAGGAGDGSSVGSSGSSSGGSPGISPLSFRNLIAETRELLARSPSYYRAPPPSMEKLNAHAGKSGFALPSVTAGAVTNMRRIVEETKAAVAANPKGGRRTKRAQKKRKTSRRKYSKRR